MYMLFLAKNLFIKDLEFCINILKHFKRSMQDLAKTFFSQRFFSGSKNLAEKIWGKKYLAEKNLAEKNLAEKKLGRKNIFWPNKSLAEKIIF